MKNSAAPGSHRQHTRRGARTLAALHCVRLALAGFAFCAAHGAVAAEYPVRPVRMVLPAAPGGAYDALLRGRGVATALSERWGQQVVLDNRPGASGIIGTDIVAKSAPDGYTLLMVTTAFVTNQFLNDKLPYDTRTAFTPITIVASSPNVLVAHPSLPAATVRELIDLAKRRPGKLNYASSGSGSGGHLSMELLKAMARIDITHVPYKSAGPAVGDVVAGHVQLLITAISSASPHIRNGRLKALATTGEKRSSVLPDVETIAEAGLSGYSVAGWYGIFGPRGMPADLVSRIHGDIVDVLRLPQVASQIASFGFDVGGAPPAEFARYLDAEARRWGTLIRTVGIRAD